jgi:hypothetical protein
VQSVAISWWTWYFNLFLLISTRAGGESWYFFMILGGINFLLHYRFLTGNFKEIGEDSEFKTFIKIMVCPQKD